MPVMYQVKNVLLGHLIPNDSYVYTENLTKAVERWDQKAFDNGAWVNVVEIDKQYYVPDGNHRIYVAMFFKNKVEARVRIVKPQQVLYSSREVVEEQLLSYQANINRIKTDGVNDFFDLRGKVRTGSWQRELARENREKRAQERWGLPLHEAVSLGLMRDLS